MVFVFWRFESAGASRSNAGKEQDVRKLFSSRAGEKNLWERERVFFSTRRIQTFAVFLLVPLHPSWELGKSTQSYWIHFYLSMLKTVWNPERERETRFPQPVLEGGYTVGRAHPNFQDPLLISLLNFWSSMSELKLLYWNILHSEACDNTKDILWLISSYGNTIQKHRGRCLHQQISLVYNMVSDCET